MSLFQLAAFGMACAAVYHIIPRRVRWVVLLVASYGFYAARSLSGLPFILATTLSTWLVALRIDRIASTANKDLVMDTNPTSGAAALLWTQNGTICQDFVAVGEANDAYSFRLANNPSMTLTASGSGVSLQAYTGSASQQWKLSNNSEDTASASAKLASIMTVHPNGKNLGSSYSFAGASQCMGFGREVFYRMYDQQARWNYDGSPKSASDGKMYSIKASSTSYSASSIKGVISKAKPGDVLQMNKPKMHTMIFVSSDADGFTVYDANWTAANTVSVRYVKYGAWASRNSSGITLLHATNYPKN